MSHLVLRPKPDAYHMYAQDQVVIHTAECKHRKPMPLLYKNYYMGYCLYTEDYIDSLIEQERNTPNPTGNRPGQRKILKEIFIIVIDLIFSFWAALQQGRVDLWLLLSKCRKNNDMQAYNKKGLITGSIVENRTYT
jgi:hypothetical protein